MSFDLSRKRFDARKDYQGVVMQQGRVQLDADWNEWVAEVNRRHQAGTLDTLGASAVPRITPDGFLVTFDGDAMTLGPGRIYVDGLLAQNHGAGPDLWDPLLAELTGSEAIAYDAQPYYPDPETLPTSGTALVFLDVWQRDVTALQDPGLVEQAVGVDTTGRLQTVWQVRFLEGVGDITCSTPDEDIPDWDEVTAPAASRLSTATGVPDFEPDPCRIPPNAGYRGLENQLYRVEVHRGGTRRTATFKWSRDNGTVASRVTHINAGRDRLTVESTGRDDVLRFDAGDWVEITDDWRVLNGLAGELHRISPLNGVDDTARTLLLESPLPADAFPTDAQEATDATRHTIVRRWDQVGLVHDEDGTELQNLDSDGAQGVGIPAAGTRVFLEHGILVDFGLLSGGEFKPGEYWVFAARSADASIELLDEAPPDGPHHHFARLAVVNFPNTVIGDCRTLWPPQHTHRGCATYVLSPDANWQATLESLEPGEDAHICFQRGEYRSPRRLELRDLGHLTISGAGAGTVLIAEGRECFLHLIDCASVKVSDIAMVAPDPSDPERPISDLNGVLTTTGCPSVEVCNTDLATAASAREDRACLTVRQTDRGTANQPAERVVVSNNRMRVGDGQIGALITDAAVVRVEGNDISGDGDSLSDGDLSNDPKVTKAIEGRLVANMTADAPAPRTPDERVITGGRFVARFPSTMAQGDWERAVRATPPTEAELNSEETFTRYVSRVRDELAQSNDSVPWLGEMVEALRLSDPTREIPADLSQRLLVRDAPQVETLTATSAKRDVTLVLGSFRVSFDSVFDEGQWNALLNANGTSRVSSNDALAQAVWEAARRLIEDRDFRRRFTFAEELFADFDARAIGVAGQGIVCAGSQLGEVSVTGNHLERVLEGIHIAVSRRGAASEDFDQVAVASVSDNCIDLALPVSARQGGRGVFVGNAQRVLITQNNLSYARSDRTPLYRNGIELWGYYGPMVLFRENVVENAERPIRMTVEGEDSGRNALWRSVGNLGINGETFTYERDPDGPGGGAALVVRESDNVIVSR